MTNNYDPLSEQDIAKMRSIGAMYLRNYAYDLPIYQWMKKFGIGESDYGVLMDKLGRRAGVFDHRHFGHHIIYDFPLGDVHNIPDFLEHLLISDFFTKQGIPILPGEFLGASGIQEFCSVQTLRWNFINAFDLLSGTLSIYAGIGNIRKYWDGTETVDSFVELAKQLGIGALELAVALSTKNPFLLLGAVLSLAGTTQGTLNSPSKAYFRKILGRYVLVVAPDTLSMDRCWDEFEYTLKQGWEGYSIHDSLSHYSFGK